MGLHFIFVFFWFTTLIKNIVSQPWFTDCPLEFKNLTSPLSSTCEEGTWNGFLNDKCCKEPFNIYLDALALRANQTGEIYINSTDQTSCLRKIKDNITDVFSCGIDKLSSRASGCSGYLVQDVLEKLGDQVLGLSKGCDALGLYTRPVHFATPSFSGGGSDDLWNETCGDCVTSWNEIKGVESGDNEPDLCRFAVLTTLTSSRLDDYIWMRNIRKCLGGIDKEFGENTDPQGKKKSGNESHIIGLLSGISALAVICIYILAKRIHKWHQAKEDDGPHGLPKNSRYLKLPLKEIHYATNNLDQSNYIGEGTAGKVYRGVLSNKQHVAIKHIVEDGLVETFLREVRNLALVRHPNLVALVGYCDNGDEVFLVYELCVNGNLSEWLFSTCYKLYYSQIALKSNDPCGLVVIYDEEVELEGKNEVLSWIKRIEIAVDCARGLWFLHTYSEGCIVHRDIKPTNILLGPNCEAKLSDFGLSKVIDIGQTYASSEVRGTFGYVDPEYQGDRQVNSAADVYSFGIVLLQILSGRRVINMNASIPIPIERTAKSLTKGGSITGFADPKLEGEYSEEAFKVMFKVALSCTGNKQERPSMQQVVERLEKAHEISVSDMSKYLQKTPDLS